MRNSLFVVFPLVACLGCGEATPPIREAKPIADNPPATGPAVSNSKAPEKSDPSAIALVNAALKAHTNGKPELVQALKSVQFTRDGIGLFQGPTPVKNKWTVYASWPDKLRFRGEFPGPQVVSLCRNGDSGWRHSSTSGSPNRQDFTPEMARDVKTDSSGEWLLLLFPLTESNTIVAPAEEITVLGKPANGVRVWAAGITDAIVYFDKESKLLVQLTFDGREDGRNVTKEVLALGHKAYGGITLPEKIVYKAAGNQLAEWTLLSVEPKATIDPKVFESP